MPRSAEDERLDELFAKFMREPDPPPPPRSDWSEMWRQLRFDTFGPIMLIWGLMILGIAIVGAIDNTTGFLTRAGSYAPGWEERGVKLGAVGLWFAVAGWWVRRA